MGITYHFRPLSSAVLSHEINMLAVAVLLVLSVTAQAAKYDYDSYGRDVYYEEPSYTYEARPMYGYESRYKRSADREWLSEEELRSFVESVREMAIARGLPVRDREAQQSRSCRDRDCLLCLPLIGCLFG